MNSLEFFAVIGKEKKKVRLIQASAKIDNWQLYVEEYFLGQIVKKNDDWRAWLNDKGLEEITGDDVLVIGSFIEENC